MRSIGSAIIAWGRRRQLPRTMAVASMGSFIAWVISLGAIAYAEEISGYEQQTNQVLVGAGGFTSVPVSCSTGKKVVSGGFIVETSDDVRIYSSDPSDGSSNLIDDGWNVFVQNAGSVARQVTTIATCVSAPISGYEQQTNQVLVGAGAFTSVPVSCSAGNKVVGGGFSIETPDDVKVYSSDPSDGSSNLIDDGWNVFVQNAGSVARQVTTIAICVSDPISGYEQQTNQVLVGAGGSSSVPVSCSTGKKVVGGGFTLETPDDVKLDSSDPSDGGGNLIDDGWNVSVENAGSVERQVTAIAICASPVIFDTTAPETTILAGPSGTTRNATATFEFGSSEPDSSFQCSFELAPYAPCSSPQTYGPLADGPHLFAVRATDRAGNTDPTPATRSFAVEGPPEPPALGVTVNAAVVRGEVLVGIPDTALPASVRASQKGVRFVPLEQVRSIPVGSFLDTRRGTVRLTSARDTRGRTQSGNFASGLFQVLQSRRRSARGLTDVVLKGSSFTRCRAGRRGKRSTRLAQSRLIRRLRANARGRFRTRGRHSAATVRGTTWTTTDRCDGTLTRVTRGKVAVRDFRRRKTITIRAGKSYLARGLR